MSKNELSLLLDHMRKADHWEMLGELSARLQRAAENIDNIHHSFEGISQARAELPFHLAEATVLIEASKYKLAIMAGEWNKTMDATVEEMQKQYVNFDEMEF